MRIFIQIIRCFLSIIFLASSASAATLHTTDGTQIVGEIIDFTAGTYRLDSPSLGRVEIHQSSIRRIDYSGAWDSSIQPAPGQSLHPGIESIQQVLMNDQGLFALIQALQSDPQLQAVLKDPDILQAIASGNTQSLMSNEAFMKLMQNPQIMRITRQARDRLTGEHGP